MSSYKEIVTKAVIGKGKKSFRNKYSLSIEDDVDTVLGCWVINHNILGSNEDGKVRIIGEFDINIWYSYDDNTKTDVASKRITYEEVVNVRLKEESNLSDNSEIIIRSLKNPTCVDVSNEGNTIEYIIEKELGVEIIGDTKVKIMIEPEEDDYDIIDDDIDEAIMNEIEENVNEDYLQDLEEL